MVNRGADRVRAIPYEAFLGVKFAEEFIGTDELSSWPTYAVTEPDTDRATELMESAGYSLKNGQWHDPSGERVELEIPIPAWGNGIVQWHNQVYKQDLEDFGFTANVTGLEAATYTSQVWEGGEFDITYQYFATGPHPYYQFESALTVNNPAVNSGQQAEWEVPMPVGNPDGDLQTINVVDKHAALRTTQDEAEAKRLVTEIAWAMNQHLPGFMLHGGIPDSNMDQFPEGVNTGWFVKTDNWSTTANENPQAKLMEYVGGYMTGVYSVGGLKKRPE